MLQMDIEGAEYEALLAAPVAVLRRFRTIVVEFHHVESLVHPVSGPLIASVFRRLSREFVPVHIHANNKGRPLRIGPVTYPRLLEVTWLRRDRCRRMDFIRPGTHPLDCDNIPARPRFLLTPEWYAPTTNLAHIKGCC